MSLVDKNVFLALATVAWADGKIEPDEADAIVRAALDAGMELEEIAAVEAAAKAPVTLDAIDVPSLSKEDRLFVYAVACWIGAIDGETTEAESKAIDALAEALGVPEKLRARAEALVEEIAELPDDRRPDRYDLERLRALLSERLVASAK